MLKSKQEPNKNIHDVEVEESSLDTEIPRQLYQLYGEEFEGETV